MFRSIIAVFAAACAMLIFSLPASAAPNAIFSCQATGQVANVDPIVSPGQASAHEHQFFGGGPVTTTETTAGLLSKSTTCVETGNKTAYWMPSVYQNGQRLQPTTSKHNLDYYNCRHNSSICSSIDWFPEDLGLVAGNAHASSPSDNPVFRNGLSGWRCGTGGGTFYPVPPTCAAGAVLVASVTFGNCLFSDGSHSDAVNSNCIGAGGTPIIRIQQYFRYRLLYSISQHQVTLGAMGLAPYTLHSDRLEGFKPETAQDFLNKCVHPGVACGKNPSLVG